MKYLYLFLLFIVAFGTVQGQTFSEWFKQNKTQKKYLLQQIAALQVYIGFLEKGYKIADQGLTLIGDIKSGHFSLDTSFFNGLAIVGPSVKRYQKIANIISLQLEIVQLSKKAINHARQAGQFTDKELSYLGQVYAGLLDRCSDVTQELINITSDHVLEMSDDERIARVDKLYADMSDCYSFANAFKNDCLVMSLQRSKEQTDAIRLGKLYGIQD